ncbi:MAG TPA: site-specific integrase [Candidatus Acidoferrum sp.]|nr:site-specific integrase [Candidatus Acidoferrum sp.]
MPRRPQFGSVYKRGDVYRIKYYVDGRASYESSKSNRYLDAQKLLEKRRVEVYSGTHLDRRTKRTMMGELFDLLIRDYKINGKRVDWVEGVVRKHLRPYFGTKSVGNFKFDAAQAYVDKRQTAGAANATINRGLSLLHRALVLGKEAGVIAAIPRLPKKLAENNVRKGFFERDRFVALRKELPAEVRPIATYAYWTGCRRAEILGLQWPQVDLEHRVVRLEPGETKDKEARTIPLAQEVVDALKSQKEIRDREFPDCPWVFFRGGNAFAVSRMLGRGHA